MKDIYRVTNLKYKDQTKMQSPRSYFGRDFYIRTDGTNDVLLMDAHAEVEQVITLHGVTSLFIDTEKGHCTIENHELHVVLERVEQENV